MINIISMDGHIGFLSGFSIDEILKGYASRNNAATDRNGHTDIDSIFLEDLFRPGIKLRIDYKTPRKLDR